MYPRYLRLVVGILFVAMLFQYMPMTDVQIASAAEGADVFSAGYCNWAALAAELSVSDGSNFRPGETFSKIWRFKNIGTCTWTPAYQLVFYKGALLESPSTVFSLYRTVKPGETIDLSIPMRAPAVEGHYRGYWMLKGTNGKPFGIGTQAVDPFWVDINVVSDLGGIYDFTANVCAATWRSGAGLLPCPMVDGDSRGFATLVNNPTLENGTVDNPPGLLMFPENKYSGYIQGTYPEIVIQKGDRFRGVVGCAYGSSCYVTYRLDYQVDNGVLKIFWKWNEKNEGQIHRVDLDLSSLAGKRVKFTLTLLAVGSAVGDRAYWVQPVLARAGGSLPLPTVSVASPTPAAPTASPTIAPISGTVAFDYATNLCVAAWRNASGSVPCPSNNVNSGIANYLGAPRLEDNSMDVLPGILLSPQYKTDGYIQGTYIPVHIEPGDVFRTAIGCEYGKFCNVNFRMDYQIDNGPVQNLGQWSERQDGKVNHLTIDLNFLAGKDVRFIFTLQAAGSPAGDSAVWAHPFLMRPGAHTPTPTPLISATPTVFPETRSDTLFDFAANACQATWLSGAGAVGCPGQDGSASGFVLPVVNPPLESGAVDNALGLIMHPQNITNGYLRGTFPAITVQKGDRFQSIVNCAYGVSCYVNFRLEYQVASGPITTLASWVEKNEGLFLRVDRDLSSLAGKNVKFILTILASGTATGDRALWSQPRLVRAGMGSATPTVTPTVTQTPSLTASPTGTVTPTAEIMISPSPTGTPEGTGTLTATPTALGTMTVTGVQVAAYPIFTACYGPNVVDFLGKITTDGAGTVTYHWEIGGDSNTTSATETITFASAGTQQIYPGAYKVDCGNYYVRLVVTSPNQLQAQADFHVQPPTPLPESSVLVFFHDQSAYVAGTPPYEKAVQRTVSSINLPREVLREMYKGPSSAEQALGYSLITSGTTGVTEVSVIGGIAHVTLAGPCNSQGATYTVGNLIRANLNQFPEIQHIRIYDQFGNTGNPDPNADSIPACLEP